MLKPLFSKILPFFGCVGTILNYFASENDLILSNIENYNLNFPVVRIDTTKKLQLKNLKIADYKNFMRRDFFFTRKYDVYLIDLDVSTTKNVMECLQMNPSFNANGTFIFLTKEVTSEMLQVLQTYFIKYTIFLNIETGAVRSPSTFPPNKIIGLGMEVCVGDNHSFMKISNDHILTETPSSPRYSIVFLEYPPYAICLDCIMQGIEVDILNFVSKVLKLKVNYTEIKKVALPLKFLVEDKSFDAVAGGVIFYNPFISHSFPYMQDYISWYLPISEEIQKWKYIYRVFSKELWIFCIGFVLLTANIWCVIILLLGREKSVNYFENLSNFLLKKVKIFLEQANRYNTEFCSQNVLMTCILFFSFFVDLLYKIKFSYFLLGVNFDKDIITLKEMQDRNYKVLMFEGMVSFFNEDPPAREYINLMFEECDKSVRCLDKVAFEKNAIVFRLSSNAEYFARFKKYYDRYGRWLLRRLKYYGVGWPRSIRFRVGHPLFPVVNKHLKLMTEFGFVDYITSKYLIKPLELIGIEKHPFGLDHLKAPFMLWIVGMVVSLAAFYLEVSQRVHSTRR